MFYATIICYNPVISIAAICYIVYGYGQYWSPAIINMAASITAVPLIIVAIYLSWPGQSTNETCLNKIRV